jgi:hypothetical protein
VPQDGAGVMPAMARLPARGPRNPSQPMLPGGLTAPGWYPLAIRACVSHPLAELDNRCADARTANTVAPPLVFGLHSLRGP